jgi:phosphate uptake regulator
MITYQGLDRNFKFMILEIKRQLEATYQLLSSPSDRRVRGVVARDSYIDTLKSLIERKCLSFFRHTPTIDKQSANMVTALNVVSSNLERIADFCVNVVLRARRLDPPTFCERFNYKAYFDELLEPVDLILDAITKRDTDRALRLCQAEAKLDGLYKADYQRIREDLRTGEDTDNLLMMLDIIHYLERMGDSLLNIGEAVLLAATGEKMKLHEYVRLASLLGSDKAESVLTDYSVAFNWETRSGARIGKVEDRGDAGHDFEGIFKKGQADKLLKEKENIERWEKIAPGMPPRVLEFWEEEGDAALLLEYLEGFTIQELIVNGEAQMISMALSLIESTLSSVWTQTRKDEALPGTFVTQAQKRFKDVLRVHPEYGQSGHQIGTLQLASTADLLEAARKVEVELPAPFQVLIHGDFNLDNILFNYREERLHFLDLHRSRLSDYVQDVATFLVSNYRMPIFRGNVRRTLHDVGTRFHTFASSFAAQQQDETFDARLALGLARAFLTSTRFELDAGFAKGMYMRSTYLMEKILRHAGKEWRTFELDWAVLDY